MLVWYITKLQLKRSGKKYKEQSCHIKCTVVSGRKKIVEFRHPATYTIGIFISTENSKASRPRHLKKIPSKPG